MTSREHAHASRFWPALLWLSAVALTLLAVVLCVGVAAPLLHLDALRLDRARVRKAQEVALSTGSAELREGYALLVAMSQFTAALRDPSRLDALQESLASIAAAARHTQTPRLAQAAVRGRRLELAGRPVADWWRELAPYLNGLEHADFSHFQQPLRDAWRGVFEAEGLPTVEAAHMAELAVGDEFGPFLQHASRMLTSLEQSLEAAGDADAARTCRTLRRRLLRQWILERGPAGLRLLAADLLQRELCNAAASNEQALANDLAAWRAAYRDAARKGHPPLMGVSRMPDPAPEEERTYLGRLLKCVALAGGVAGASLLAMVSGLSWRRSPRQPSFGRAAVNACIGAVACAGLALLAAPSVGSNADRAHLQNVWPWILPAATGLFAALAGPLLLTWPAIRSSPGRGRFAATCASACGLWLLLAAGLCATGGYTSSAAREMTRKRALALEDRFAAVAGPQSQELLTRLRAWTP